MINRRKEVEIADVNSNTIQVIDVPESISTTSYSGTTDVGLYYPIEIQIINDCGASVEYLIISNIEEWNLYQANPTTYSSFVRLPKGATLTDDFTSFNRCLKFLVRGYETTATKKLTIEFINYKRSQL